jgi:hypothetical protein
MNILHKKLDTTVECLYRLVDDIASDEVDGGLRPEPLDVPEIVLARAGQVGVDGSRAQYPSFNSDHPRFRFS